MTNFPSFFALSGLKMMLELIPRALPDFGKAAIKQENGKSGK